MVVTVSIIICTRNRAESLRPTLDSIGKVTVPSGWYVELLIVDNGSTDHTSGIVSETRLNNVVLRYTSEPKTGQAHARNTGLLETTGQIILFTDDDVRVPGNWIEEMCRPILEGTADAVQGGIRPAPHLERPWLTRTLRFWVAAIEDPVSPPVGLVGANMSFHRRAVEITGGFDPRLGPGAVGFYDDTMFGWALLQGGQRVLYRPTVAVEHHFSPDRLTLGSFIQIAKRQAVSRAIVAPVLDPSANLHPSFMDVLRELPFFGVQCVKQVWQYVKNRTPHAGFLSRYYNVCLLLALRKRSRALGELPSSRRSPPTVTK